MTFAADARTAYVRPHELQVVAAAQPGSVAVTLAQALTVGPNTRLEFRRSDGDRATSKSRCRARNGSPCATASG